MATVYLAEDLKHHREVALKVLRPDLAASLGGERFLKEIQISARLNHPHILALHDSGDAGGFLFYTMPYVDGGSLRQRLERDRRLDLAPAIGIAERVADALSYAHRMGVFHRDIKPENILFSQGHPIVGDFGIAKAISTAGGANITRTGFPLGTPGYMSPEQAAGLTDLDERTDVYSLAVVIYEMLVGETPGRWPTEDSMRAGRFLEAAPSHRSRLAPLPPPVEPALVRAMSIRYDQRTATPADLMAQLRGHAAPPPLAHRVYSQAEVERIVARAAELEAQAATLDGSMTIGGVEKLAGEVGIAPEVVRRAAAAVSPVRDARAAVLEPPRDNFFLGGPTRLLIERTVEGELPDTEYPVVVDEIRRTLSHVGQVSQLGRSFSWSAANFGQTQRGLEVVVTVRSGYTRIVIQERLGNLIGGIYGGVGGGMGGGGMGPILGGLIEGLGMNPLVATVVVPLWLTLTYFTARTSYYYATRSRQRQLTQLADRLEVLCRELMPVRPALRHPSPPPALRP
jgi:serine/threonine protein kinase